LTVPRMPLTVRTEAPANLEASSWLVNMPDTKAVWRRTLKGVPGRMYVCVCGGGGEQDSRVGGGWVGGA
jgi:hypothetical protein